MGLTLRGNFAQLNRLASSLAAVGSPNTLLAVSAALGADAIEFVQRGFARGQSPDGATWAPLKSREGQPLRDTARLQRSLTHARSSTAGFKIGTNVAYAGYHQFGTKKMVSRPFLPVDRVPPEWLREFEKSARSILNTALGFAAGLWPTVLGSRSSRT